MSQTVSEVKDNLTGMLHGGTLNKVRNIEYALQRAAITLLTKIDPVDTIRTVPLTSTVHDDVYNYALPSYFKKIIDLIPQDNRHLLDMAVRRPAWRFDLQKAIKNKVVSIEGDAGAKIIRINWRSRQGKVLSTLNDTDDNGTWSAVATASGLAQDTIFKVSGSGSVKFDLAATGDGIQNTTLLAVDLTDEDEVADIFLWFYLKNSTDLANFNSVTLRWGNDLTTNYWTAVAQTTQADGSAFKVGWNLVRFYWNTATETGTVTPSTVDSCRITFSIDAAISDIRVDNIVFSIGRNFDLKLYSKYIFQNSAGTLIARPTSDDDTVLLDDDAMQIYLLEALKACAQQVEGEDSTFDISFSNVELDTLYRRYRAEYPSQAKKLLDAYGSQPHFSTYSRR